MSRYLSIYFTNLLADYLAIKKPELKDTVYVFTMSQKNRIMVTAASREAEKQGIFTTMVLDDAKAIVPDILACDDKFDFNKKLLIRIAKWAIRYSPTVAIDMPDGIILDSSGCSHLLWHDKVYRHRDYFDAGALLYEHLPVLGRVIAWLKRRMG